MPLVIGDVPDAIHDGHLGLKHENCVQKSIAQCCLGCHGFLWQSGTPHGIHFFAFSKRRMLFGRNEHMILSHSETPIGIHFFMFLETWILYG